MRGVRGSAAFFPIRIRPSCCSPSPHARASSLRRRMGRAAPARGRVSCRLSRLSHADQTFLYSLPSARRLFLPPCPVVTSLSKFSLVVFPLALMPEPTQPSDLRTAALPQSPAVAPDPGANQAAQQRPRAAPLAAAAAAIRAAQEVTRQRPGTLACWRRKRLCAALAAAAGESKPGILPPSQIAPKATQLCL